MNLCYVSFKYAGYQASSEDNRPSNMMPMLKSMIADGISDDDPKAVLRKSQNGKYPSKTRATRKIANIAINITDPPPPMKIFFLFGLSFRIILFF